MTKRQPKGIPVGGEFAANEHDEASAALGLFGLEPTEERVQSILSIPHAHESVQAQSVLPGDTLHFDRWDDDLDQDVTDALVVSRVESSTGLDLRKRVNVSFESGESMEFIGTANVRATRGAERPAGRDPKELNAELRRVGRMFRGDFDVFPREDQDSVIAAASDPGADEMVAARARQLADSCEAHNYHDTSIRLRAAAERIRISRDPASPIQDAYSLAYALETPKDLVMRAVQDFPGDAIVRNPNAPAEALEIVAKSPNGQGQDMGWLRKKIADHPNTSSKVRAEMRRIGY